MRERVRVAPSVSRRARLFGARRISIAPLVASRARPLALDRPKTRLIMRATWLVLQNLIHEHYFDMRNWRGFYFILNTFPVRTRASSLAFSRQPHRASQNFLFFSCYLQILYLWVRVYHRTNNIASGASLARARPVVR